MVNVVENHFQIAWQLRLKFFYFFAKFHALAHFTYVENRNKVSFCFISTIYGLVWVVGYSLLIASFLCSTSVDDSVNRSDVLVFVNTVENVTILLKGFFIFLLQVIQSKGLVLLINATIAINQLLEITNSNRLRSESLYNYKKWCVLFQFVLLSISYYLYMNHKDRNAIQAIYGFLIVYTHFLTAVVSGLYLYGSLLFAYQFYYSLNGQLTQVIRGVQLHPEMGRYCQASDELDKISVTYSRINAYVASINRLFTVQVAFELLVAFVLITCVLFYTFYALLSQESYGTFDSMMYSGIYCTVYFIEIYTITRISNTVIDEREKLSTFIHRRAYFDADSRFIQSIQQLSLKAFCERPTISAMGFFIIDRSLVIGIGATIVTYLVILVQFQLDRTKYSVNT